MLLPPPSPRPRRSFEFDCCRMCPRRDWRGSSADYSLGLRNHLAADAALSLRRRRSTRPLAPTGWKIGSAQLAAGELTIEPDSDAGVAVAGQFYRGTFHLIPVSATTFDVVNHVDIDSYIKGVLTREMRREFLPEAYEAQAIVSRTYALYEWKFAPHGRSWDLYADTRSQMYGGVAAETDKSRDATDRTRRRVVASGPAGQERIFKAYFSACCGGAGQSAAQAFGDPAAEALSDRAVGNRCAESPRFNWGPVIIPKDVLTRRLREFGLAHGRSEKDMAALAGIEIARSNASGRPIEFTVTDARSAISADRRRAPPGRKYRCSVALPCRSPACIRADQPHRRRFLNDIDEQFRPPGLRRLLDPFRKRPRQRPRSGYVPMVRQAEAKQGISHERIVLDAFHGAKLVRAY